MDNLATPTDYPLAPIFDKAIEGLEARMTKALIDNQCAYRDGVGKRGCLFGQMMTDEAYSEAGQIDPFYVEDEGWYDGGENVSHTDVRLAIEKSQGIKLDSFLLISELISIQQAHDNHWEPGKKMRPLLSAEIQKKIWGEVVYRTP